MNYRRKTLLECKEKWANSQEILLGLFRDELVCFNVKNIYEMEEMHSSPLKTGSYWRWFNNFLKSI